jgi:hypothetical protein
MNSVERYEAQIKIINLMINIYEMIEEIETKINKKILVFEKDFVTYKSNSSPKGFGLKQEPFLLGDAFGFTVYKDSIDKEEIYQIYNYYKQLLKIDFDFHLIDGFYETNDYTKGNIEFFRGYCIDILTKFHKQETINALKKVKINTKVPN